jgi:photosystem II stability/assembly factor-like uncharacterized protein
MLVVGSLASLLLSRDAGAQVPDTFLDGMRWRLVGPFRGGWSTMATGVPDKPDTFYFTAAGGGVWKTSNAGRTWTPIFDDQPIASVGAIAIAHSNPQVIYVGTGQPEPRYDIAAGNGVYGSNDGGRTWQHLGLSETRHIGAIYVDPRDANVVLVAALGHIFGPNPERGVYRSADGGRTWTRTLFVDDLTGAVDLASDPTSPDLVLATTWQARNWPWLNYFTPVEGPGSGVFKSNDGGKTWVRLAGEGWPSGNLGRIGVAMAQLPGGTRIYASVASEKAGGLYRSDDGGAHWQKMGTGEGINDWYGTRLTLAPGNADTLYSVGRSISRSTDGGKTFTTVRGAPGGDDYHSLWINPQHPERMIAASDQGTIVSVDGGATWSSWFNQPTGQFYRLAADDRFPYWIYSGQQDSGTVAIASRSDYGAIGFRDWHPVGGDERDPQIPDPADPNLVYGTGLGGRVSRWDARTGEVQNVSPWPVNSYGKRPTDFLHRYTWIAPLAFERSRPPALYAASQVLFRSTDQGRHWDAISPDLSARKPEVQSCQGDLSLIQARDCGYGVIYSIGLSPRHRDEIWVGTDDGLIQLTRNAGKTWRNVTPPGVAPWSKVSTVDPSSRRDGVAFVAIDNHRQDDFQPHLWRTRDYGATWTEIDRGLPTDHFASVIREDPAQSGLLYLGTELGVFVSFDDGDHWQSLRHNLPPAWVRDLLVHGDDLIAATQGRGIWVLDNLAPIRQARSSHDGEAFRLIRPPSATRWRADQGHDTPFPPETPLGENPPGGAFIDYWLASDSKQPVVLEVKDASGSVVRRLTSADPPEQLTATRYFAEDWLRPQPSLSGTTGAHRFVWDLRYPRPKSIRYEYSIAATPLEGAHATPQGPLVLPGEYHLRMTVDGTAKEVSLIVKMDPRVEVPRVELAESLELSRTLGRLLERVWRDGGEIRLIRKQLETLRAQLTGHPEHQSLAAKVGALDAATERFANGEGEHTLNFEAISETLASIATDLEATDRGPTAAQMKVTATYRRQIDQASEEWTKVRGRDLPPLNEQLRSAGFPVITVPTPEQILSNPPTESKDLR